MYLKSEYDIQTQKMNNAISNVTIDTQLCNEIYHNIHMFIEKYKNNIRDVEFLMNNIENMISDSIEYQNNIIKIIDTIAKIIGINEVCEVFDMNNIKNIIIENYNNILLYMDNNRIHIFEIIDKIIKYVNKYEDNIVSRFLMDLYINTIYLDKLSYYFDMTIIFCLVQIYYIMLIYY